MVEQILLERVRVLSHDLTSAARLFSYCYGLQAVEMDTSRIEDFSEFFYYCPSLRSIPRLDTGNGRDFSYMFSGCSSLVALPALDTSNGIFFRYMFAWMNDYGGALSALPLLNTRRGREFNGMFDGTTLRTIPALDLSGIRGEIGFSSSNGLGRIDVVGIGAANDESITVNVSWTALDAAALNGLYRNLEPITCGGSVYISGTPGCQQAEHQPELATSKGWTIYY
jgi:hypothetical protein